MFIIKMVFMDCYYYMIRYCHLKAAQLLAIPLCICNTETPRYIAFMQIHNFYLSRSFYRLLCNMWERNDNGIYSLTTSDGCDYCLIEIQTTDVNDDSGNRRSELARLCMLLVWIKYDVWFIVEWPLYLGLVSAMIEGLVLRFHIETHIVANDAIGHYRCWSTLDHVMAWCLMAPSHYPIQCWLVGI